uniref:CSON000170 protein n=1 Tax=Culicoides sonorensis TaxID=179676 RepID=A0A336K3M1_CULSO
MKFMLPIQKLPNTRCVLLVKRRFLYKSFCKGVFLYNKRLPTEPSGILPKETSHPEIPPSENLPTETSHPEIPPSENLPTETSHPEIPPSEILPTETSHPEIPPSENLPTETSHPEIPPSEILPNETSLSSVFKCDCHNKIFSSLISLRSHNNKQRLNIKGNIYLCGICLKISKTFTCTKEHIRRSKCKNVTEMYVDLDKISTLNLNHEVVFWYKFEYITYTVENFISLLRKLSISNQTFNISQLHNLKHCNI